jgi:predicted RNase H-like HicB family nuclease
MVMMMKKVNVQVLIEIDEDGKYVASCPSLEGCHTQGDTYEEAIVNTKDVIKMCIEEMEENKETLNLKYPEIIGTRMLEIASGDIARTIAG